MHPRADLRAWMLWSAGTALTLYCLVRFGFFSGDFLHGLGKFGSVVIAQLFPPKGFEQLPMFAVVMGETIAMALIGTLLGAVFAFPLSFLASKKSWHFARPACSAAP